MSEALTRRRALAGCVAMASVPAARSALADVEDSPSSAIADIRALLERQEADWNRGDLDAFVKGYWNSTELVFQSGGRRTQGYEAMVDRYRKRYKAEGKAMGRLAFSSVEVIPLSADSAFARGAWRLTMPDGATPGGLFTLILRQLPEGWRIVHDHTSAEDPPRPK
ncbi:hypothetical protein OJF2_23570 [Aquisphaera giovannonii]|uniref:DUF4440 domain-containing protein n=1 Tax=Aquisphaera giovannonii TaxID=406548 RepID=A0A5B9W0L5_9BACT|nr:nuclear transport factor 2 family protein [Aquisphaera giovannonii]QEH33827.1 hypothetical protein OJF2_23570 [Aquisphaera giovannonii]